jgi:hypothetical protein
MYALFEAQEPLPPYEFDPAFDSPALRKRIGEVIAKAMGKRIPKREDRPRRQRVVLASGQRWHRSIYVIANNFVNS